MTNDRFNQLKIEIQLLRAKLIETYTDDDIDYADVLTLSQELDTLIIEYHRLLAEINRKRKNN